MFPNFTPSNPYKARMMKKIMLTAGALALMAGQLLADGLEGPPPDEMPPADMPQITLMPPPPEGEPPPEPPEDVGEPPMDPEEAKDWLLGIVYPMMDIDGSGELSYEEVRAWVAWVHIPLMEHMEHPPEPPPEEEPPRKASRHTMVSRHQKASPALTAVTS